MSLNIKVFPKPTDKQTREEELAYQLKELFETQLPGAEGRIAIHANVSLYGYSAEYREVDLLVIACFDPPLVKKVLTPVRVDGLSDVKPVETEVAFHNICWVIEAKDHRSFKVSADDLYVQYKGRDHNVTAQSEGQKNGVRNMFNYKFNIQISPVNLIWLPGLDRSSLPPSVSNLIGKSVSVLDLLSLACHQKMPYWSTRFRQHHMSSSNGLEQSQQKEIVKYVESLSREEIKIGLMTRTRLERVTKTILRGQQYAQEIGSKMVIIRGRAGTGKTVKLLSIAHDLARRQGKAVKILTYNKALVADIRRLCALSGINDVTEGLISVDTVHSMVYGLARGFPMVDQELLKEFFKNYLTILETLAATLESGVLNSEEHLALRSLEICRTDFVMVDEAQDWPEEEKRLLMALFGPKQIIIADGIDQMVRGRVHTAWTESLDPTQYFAGKAERRSLRQEANLGRFITAFCRETSLPWDVAPNDELPGGRVVIKVGRYTRSLHELLYADCKEAGNLAYEMLFMVPPSMVDKGAENSAESIRQFRFKEEWEEWGVKIWDGTSTDNRIQYPNNVDQHRLIQYESCRGLEGWTAVCLNLDHLYDWKKTQWTDDPEELALFSEDERRSRFAHQWCLIPFTRAIDTLVITLEKGDSAIGQLLFKLSREFPDFVEWLED